jgi:hypothetical protein
MKRSQKTKKRRSLTRKRSIRKTRQKMSKSNVYEPNFENGKYVDKNFSPESFLEAYKESVECPCTKKNYTFKSFKAHQKCKSHMNWIGLKTFEKQLMTYIEKLESK